jgi:hypothetical protein
MEPTENTNSDVTIDTKNMSALEHNIKLKGETSYYYAHKGRFEDKENAVDAKTICGPGIITGGEPILLQRAVKPVEVIKEPKKITKYIFYDDDRFAVIKMDLPGDCKEITQECIESNFQDRAFDLRVNVPDGDPYFFSIKKLCQKIVPNESSCKLSKGKIVVSFKKKNDDEEWSKASA